MENKFNLQIILDEKILKIDNIIIDLANIHSLSFLKKESINGKQHYFYNQLIYMLQYIFKQNRFETNIRTSLGLHTALFNTFEQL